MSYQPRKIHIYDNLSIPAYEDKDRYGSYFHYMGTYVGIVDFRYALGGSTTQAKNQKIGPMESSLLITDLEYVLVYKEFVYDFFGNYGEEKINVQPSIKAGITQGGTQIHGFHPLDFKDREGNFNIVGMGSRPDIDSIKKDAVVPKGGYVWVTNGAASDLTTNPYLVAVLVRGFHFQEKADGFGY